MSCSLIFESNLQSSGVLAPTVGGHGTACAVISLAGELPARETEMKSIKDRNGAPRHRDQAASDTVVTHMGSELERSRSSRLRHGGRWLVGAWLAVVLVMAGAVGAVAEEDQPRLQIERIVVEGAKLGSEEIVLSESRLVPGQAYSEAELRQAMSRIERLPFVLATEFALRKGSKRGLHELVITVTEVSRFFFALDGEVSRGSGGETRWRGEEVDRNSRAAGGPLVAGRHVLGAFTEFSAGVSGLGYSDRDGVMTQVHATLTHYNLYGRRVVGALGGEWTLGEGDREYRLSATLAVPTGMDHAVRAAVTYTRPSSERCFVTGGTYCCFGNPELWTASLGWKADTTDDPFAPLTGHRISAAVFFDEVRSSQGRASGVELPPSRLDDQIYDNWGGELRLSRFVPIASQRSLGLSAHLVAYRGHYRAVYGESFSLPSESARFVEARVAASHIWLWRPAPGKESFTRWSLESGIGLDYSRDRFSRAPWLDDSRIDLVPVLSLVGRGRWGTVRFALGRGYGTKLWSER